ncbi:MAG: endonuclease/exonuclease/phosphatase family protein [Planctomycetota bacterium]
MTFNVRVNSERDGVNAWPARAARAVELIRRQRPDVIGFQELQAAHWATFAEALPEYGRECGPRVDNGEPWAYPAIFWNVERLHLMARGGFYLSPTPGVFSRAWESAHTRGATWVRLRLNELSGRPLLFFNTHLDNRSAPAREEQAKVLIAQATAVAGSMAGSDPARGWAPPVFVTGDFNSDPREAPYGLFAAAGFRDPFREAGGQDGPAAATFHGYTGRQGSETERMDWILMQAGSGKLTTVGCEILRDAAPPLYPSDHFPVLATVRVGEEEKQG